MRRRRKPRLFSFPREIELAHYDEVITDPHERALLIRVIETFLEISHTKRLDPRSLAPILEAASHPNPQLRVVAMTRLSVLAHYFREGAEAMAELCVADDDDIRLFAVSILGNTPPNVACPLAIRALDDPSWQIRKAAAQVGRTAQLDELVPALSQQLAREPDARVRVVIQMALDFQREAAATP